MFQIDLRSRRPIYEQVAENFKRLIITGALKENQRVPSVRELAQALTVNPNTVQKAYRELESQGYFYTVLGQGSFISAPPKQSAGASEKKSALYGQLRGLLHELLYNGEDKGAVVKFVLGVLNQPQ